MTARFLADHGEPWPDPPCRHSSADCPPIKPPKEK